MNTNDMQKRPMGLPDSWAMRFVAVACLAAALAVPSAYILSSYFDFRPLELISFTSQDGWCTQPTESFGNHCFSDHTIIREYLKTGDFWSPGSIAPAPYPPTPIGIHVFIDGVGSALAGVRGSYLLFLLLALIALLSPCLWAMRHLNFPGRAVTFLALGVASAPVLINLDRAQLTALLVPLTLMFAVSFMRGKMLLAAVCCTGAACLKPQFLILALAFLAAQRFVLPLVVGLATAIFTMLTFLLTPGDALVNASNWIANVRGYGTYSSSANWYPVNLGLSRALAFVGEAVHPLARSLGSAIQHVAIHYSLALSCVAVGATALIFIVGRRSQHSRLAPLLSVIFLTIIFPGTAFSYYTALVLPVAALVARSPTQTSRHRDFVGVFDCENRHGRFWTVYRWYVLVMLGVVLFPIAIPVILFGMGTNSPSSTLVPGAWCVLLTAAWVLSLFLFIQRRPSLPMSSPVT